VPALQSKREVLVPPCRQLRLVSRGTRVNSVVDCGGSGFATAFSPPSRTKTMADIHHPS